MIFGQALGRAANLLNGDAFGRPTGESFGIVYPTGSLAQHTYGMQPLWPAEIWEGQLDLVIFALLLLLRTTNHRKGQVFACYVFLYSTARFGLEFLRGDYGTLLWGLKSAQLTGGAMAVLALLVFALLGRFGKPIRDISDN